MLLLQNLIQPSAFAISPVAPVLSIMGGGALIGARFLLMVLRDRMVALDRNVANVRVALGIKGEGKDSTDDLQMWWRTMKLTWHMDKWNVKHTDSSFSFF